MTAFSVKHKSEGTSTAVFDHTFYEGYTTSVNLMVSDQGIPQYYWAEFHMPICLENLCNPMDLEVRWDLLGNFMDYVEYEDAPLTKFDHVPLDAADHQKLKGIIGNTESILQDYAMTDLIDTSRMVYSKEVDGMTGATSKTFETEVVSGAVYTCYALWNVVNGGVKQAMLHYTAGIMDESLRLAMLKSGNEFYIRHILAEQETHAASVDWQLFSLIFGENDYLAIQAMQALGDEFWSQEAAVAKVVEEFDSLKTPLRNAFYAKMLTVPLSTASLEEISALLEGNGSQDRKEIYAILSQHKKGMSAALKERLKTYLSRRQQEWQFDDYKIMEELEINL